MPLAALHAEADDQERFLREGGAAARLRHPQICTIHEVGEAGGRPYIVMDYIAGAIRGSGPEKSSKRHAIALP